MLHEAQNSIGMRRFSVAAVALVLMLPVAALGSPSKKSAHCPCMESPFFASFMEGQREILVCTNAPRHRFVRLVSSELDLVVLFELALQLYCGWQPTAEFTSFMPITPVEFDVCKRLMVKSAANQGMRCLPEF